MRTMAIMTAALAIGCMRPDPAGPDAEPGPAQDVIRDDGRLAGATSSTNWPPEDAGSQPVKVFGTADSLLAFTFKQAPAAGQIPEPARLETEVRVYLAGRIPLFDSVPSVTLDYPESDTLRIETDRLNSLFGNELDTLRFGLEFVTDTSRAFLSGFTYSKKRRKFLDWPSPINTEGSFTLTDPHYQVASVPDSAFKALLSGTNENEGFYYYIAGLPYFWLHSLSQDSLYVGPMPFGSVPLRCVKVTSQTGPIAKYTVEVFPLLLVKETFNDSIHKFDVRDRFKLGDPLLQFTGSGSPPLRLP